MNDTNSPVGTTGSKQPLVENGPLEPSDATTAAPDPNKGSKPTVDVSKLPPIRRRNYVIDRGRQFRTALLTSGLATVLLVIVNTAFTILRNSQTMAISSAAPQLESTLSQQDTRIGTMLILVSVIFVIGVFVITIAETHRTAGAVHATYLALERVSDGDYRTPLRLRPKDNLRDLRSPFNEMISTLRKQATADAEALDLLASSAAAADVDTAALAKELGALAEKKRELGETETKV